MELKDYIRVIPDFPRPGILFRDITPLLKDPAAFGYAIDSLIAGISHLDIDAVAGIDARGFLFAAPMAHRLGLPLIPVRKEGKLPSETLRASYSLEYGENILEVHKDAIEPEQRVLIVDDLLATGGTLAAAACLVERGGGSVSALAVVVELTALNGKALLQGHEVLSLIKY